MSTVTIVWPSEGGRSGIVELPWLPGKRVKHYTMQPPLRQYGVGALVKKCRIYNSAQQRIKLSYVPAEGGRHRFRHCPDEVAHVLRVR